MQTRITHDDRCAVDRETSMQNSYCEQAIFAFFSRLVRGDDLRFNGEEEENVVASGEGGGDGGGGGGTRVRFCLSVPVRSP